jgi:uncharacterized protein (TIGR02271 family)
MAETYTSTGTIAAYFEDNADARQAVEALQRAGFSSAHLGVAHRVGAYSTTTSSDTEVGQKEESTWDKIKNWFTGNEAEPYADECTQGDLATHEVARNPADSSRIETNRVDEEYDNPQGYNTSDLHQSFKGLDVPEERSRYFSHRFGKEDKGAVVTVKAGDRVAEAESILAQYGGDLGEGAATYNYADTTDEDSVEGDYPQTTGREGYVETGRQDNSTSGRTGSPQNIQLLGEILRIHKETMNRGEARVRKEVITENQTIQVPVTREELVVERHPVSDTTPATSNIGEDEIRIPLTEERASIDKQTVVREEVSVGKRPVEEVRDLTDEVRHEELRVDDPNRRDRSV